MTVGSFLRISLLGDAHNGNGAVDILPVDAAALSAAPEPATCFLVPASRAFAGPLRRRKSWLKH